MNTIENNRSDSNTHSKLKLSASISTKLENRLTEIENSLESVITCQDIKIDVENEIQNLKIGIKSMKNDLLSKIKTTYHSVDKELKSVGSKIRDLDLAKWKEDINQTNACSESLSKNVLKLEENLI